MTTRLATHNRLFHQALSLLVLVVFVLRALVPVGYMPDMASNGSWSMVICSDQGPRTIMLDVGGSPLSGTVKQKKSDHHPDSDHRQSLCAYALTAFFGDIPLSSLPVLPFAVEIAGAFILHDLVYPGFARLRVLAPRGPPRRS